MMPTLGCTTCDPALRAAIFNEQFPVLLVTIGTPLLLGGLALGWLLRRFAGPVAGAGAFLGLGLGGFIDGILLHQVLQWHQMISSRLPPDTLPAKNVNMFWDGVFHAVCWLFTALGVALLWRQRGRADPPRATAMLLGAILLGWGAVNVLDSVFNHYLFQHHDVLEWTARPWAWNLGFLLFGIAQLAAGWLIVSPPARGRSDAVAV